MDNSIILWIKNASALQLTHDNKKLKSLMMMMTILPSHNFFFPQICLQLNQLFLEAASTKTHCYSLLLIKL